jgi:hypothetical protein
MSRRYVVPLELFVMVGSLVATDLSQVHIDTPPDGASIQSGFVGVSGRAASRACLPAQLDGRDLLPLCADSSGRLDSLLRVSSGRHEILIGGRVITFSAHPPSTPPASDVRWDLLQPADVILSHSIGSEQGDLYDATYTHAAIYLGPDENGTALLGEAVVEADAQGLGEVRTVSIENGLSYKRGQKIGIFRPVAPVSPTERDAVLAFVRGVVNRGLPYWSADQDFSLLYDAWLLWDAKLDRPRNSKRFQLVLDKLRSRKFARDRFTCAGLIWLAYWSGTHEKVDLAEPNRARIGGRMANALSPGFLARVNPYYVSPDSFLLAGKLREVSQP